MISPSLQCSYSRIFAIKYIERHLTGAESWLGGEVLHTHQVHPEGRGRLAGVLWPPPSPAPHLGVPCPPPSPSCRGGLRLTRCWAPWCFNSVRAGEKAAFPAAKQEHGSFLASLGFQPPLVSLPGSGGWGNAPQRRAPLCIWMRAALGCGMYICMCLLCLEVKSFF